MVEEEKITGRRLECYCRDNDIITSLPAQEEELGVTKRKQIKMEGGVEKEKNTRCGVSRIQKEITSGQ